MKMLVANRKFSILILPFLLASFVLVGCGEDDEDNNRLVEDNNQPVIEAIPDKIVDADGAVTVEVNITDVDGDDTHTIRASSNNKAIATVSAKNTTLTINGIAGGMATITVSVTDNSGQENAAATPITFQVTVNANSQPVIQAIPDVTLDAGAESTVAVNITDADVGDAHTISASSDDTAIAVVSVNNTTLAISGIAEGTTTITVSATDDSGKNNAAATPVSFNVTVNDPYTPFRGLTVHVGVVVFKAGGINLQAGNCISFDGTTFNGVTYDTHSFKWQRRENPASPWIDIPGTEEKRGICGYRPNRPGQYRAVWEVSVNGVRKKYASANILEI